MLARRGVWVWIFLLLALRFVLLKETLYVADEPLFQLKIDEAFAHGTFPLTSFRGSSIPLPYGAGGIWFYYLPRLFFWHPYILIFYHTLVMSLGALLFLWTMKKKYDEEAARWSGLLVATSPLLFLYSRHAWDNTILLPIGAAVIWILVKLEEKRNEILGHALLGILCGYALNVHLMFGPVALALGLALVVRAFRYHGLRSKNFWLPLLAFGLAAAAALAPYLIESYRIMQVEQPLENTKFTKRWGDLRNFWWLFQRSVIFSSLWGSRIYFEDVRAQFFQFVGWPLSFFFHVDLFGWFNKLAAWSAILAYPFLRVKMDPLRLFAFLSLVLLLLVDQYLNIPTAPHYFNPIWFLVFLGVAISIGGIAGIWKKILVISIVATAVVNTAYIFSALAYVHQNKGARAFTFGVTVAEQMRAIREICVETNARIPAEARVDLAQTFISGASFVYLPAHMPECQGVKFKAEHNLENPNFRLRHPADSETKVDLIVDWL